MLWRVSKLVREGNSSILTKRQVYVSADSFDEALKEGRKLDKEFDTAQVVTEEEIVNEI